MPNRRLRTTVITLRLFGWCLAIHVLDVEWWRMSGKCQLDVRKLSPSVIYCSQDKTETH